MFEIDSVLFPARNPAREHPPSQPPRLGQELAPSGYLSPENDPIRREPTPVNPCYLIACLWQLRDRLASPLLLVFLGLLLMFALIGDVIAGIGVGAAVIGVDVLVPMVVRVSGRIQLPDPSDASGELYGGVDLVLGIAGGLVNENSSQGKSRESWSVQPLIVAWWDHRWQSDGPICVTGN